ncbi:hypothetical protein HMPREF3156_00934 [Neisseria sp. HMSC06F02]|nr:hypothetical protein HMPREF3156_00934 [Neisseria sp. HMSC06F02]
MKIFRRPFAFPAPLLLKYPNKRFQNIPSILIYPYFFILI